MAELDRFQLRPGDSPPPFDLPGVDGRRHQLDEFSGSRLLLVVFSCNHCPYAQAWEGRLIALSKEFGPKGLATVVINPNETEHYPEDRFEGMVARAKEKGYPFPYLRDDSQEVARAYGALVTPHPFLFAPRSSGAGPAAKSMELIFQGKIDDSWEDPKKARHHYLRDALQAALKGEPVPVTTSSVIGCSVKWKEGADG